MKFTDPNRFKVRGYSSLFESKERKRLETNLRKIETSLAKEARTFKETNGRMEFTIESKSIATFINDKKGLYQEEKRKKRVSREY